MEHALREGEIHMSFADMRTLTNLLKFLGIKRDAAGVSVSIDGRCVFLECTLSVLEQDETWEGEPHKKGSKLTKVPTLIELVPMNKDLIFSGGRRSDLRRGQIELPAEVYNLGEVLPFQRILEPVTNDTVPSIRIRPTPGISLKSLDLSKAIRLYLPE
jgi:hypothetical protein